MSDRPSFMTSTFSIMSLIVVLGLTGLCIWIKDVATLKEIGMILLGGYATKKGIELSQNKINGGAKPND